MRLSSAHRKLAMLSLMAAVVDDIDSGKKSEPIKPIPIEPLKRGGSAVKRNGLCPCGSGKKHKKCCMRKAPENVQVDPVVAAS